MSMIKSYAAKEAGGELEVYEYDPGELKPQDVEVQVDYCGICHSDLSMIDNEWGFSQYPLVAGHEVIGRVVALGSRCRRKDIPDSAADISRQPRISRWKLCMKSWVTTGRKVHRRAVPAMRSHWQRDRRGPTG